MYCFYWEGDYLEMLMEYSQPGIEVATSGA